MENQIQILYVQIQKPLRDLLPQVKDQPFSSTQSTKTAKVTPIVNQKLATNISSNKQREIHNNNPVQQNLEPSPKPRKQSYSPSVTRGPKAEFKQENTESNFIPYSIFSLLWVWNLNEFVSKTTLCFP